MLEDGARDGGVTGVTALDPDEDEDTDLLIASGMTLKCGVEEGDGIESSTSSSPIEAFLGIPFERESDAEEDLREEEVLFSFVQPLFGPVSFSSISNTPASGARAITRSGCMRVGDDWEMRECLGEVVGVRCIVEEKSHDSPDRFDVTDGCISLRLSWRSTSGGRPTRWCQLINM